MQRESENQESNTTTGADLTNDTFYGSPLLTNKSNLHNTSSNDPKHNNNNNSNKNDDIFSTNTSANIHPNVNRNVKSNDNINESDINSDVISNGPIKLDNGTYYSELNAESPFIYDILNNVKTRRINTQFFEHLLTRLYTVE